MKFPAKDEERRKEAAKLAQQVERLKLFDECNTWAEFRMKDVVKGTCPKRDWLDPFWWHYSMNESKPLNRVRNFIKVGFTASLLLLVVTAACDSLKIPAICFFFAMSVLEGLDIVLEVLVSSKMFSYRDALLSKTFHDTAETVSKSAASAPLFSVTTTATDGPNSATTPPAGPNVTVSHSNSAEGEGAAK